MTREELEQVWEICYSEMVAYANRRLVDQGADVVQTAYLNMLAHETYLKQPVERARTWIWWKVRRDLDRIYKRESTQIAIKVALMDNMCIESDTDERDEPHAGV